MTFTQSMTKDDTALIISYSGTTAGLVDISKILVEKNIPYISITQINQNLISKKERQYLVSNRKMTLFQQLEQLQQQLQQEIIALETAIEQLQQDVQTKQDQQQSNKIDLQSLKTEIQVFPRYEHAS